MHRDLGRHTWTLVVGVAIWLAGCAGSNGTPTLAAEPFNLPWIADNFQVRVTNLPTPSTSTFMFTGFSNTRWGSNTLPFDLGVFGLTGCSLLVAPDVVFQITNTNGSAVWTLPIPNLPALVGLQFYNQSMNLDAGAPGGARVSNGGAGVIGAR